MWQWASIKPGRMVAPAQSMGLMPDMAEDGALRALPNHAILPLRATMASGRERARGSVGRRALAIARLPGAGISGRRGMPLGYWTTERGVASMRRTTILSRCIISGMRGAILFFQWSLSYTAS